MPAHRLFLPTPTVSSCDQEHQSALEEAKHPKNDNVVIPECAHGGLYKPVQCHPSTGYCWCVLVDTGRPIPGTSTRYDASLWEIGNKHWVTEPGEVEPALQILPVMGLAPVRLSVTF